MNAALLLQQSKNEIGEHHRAVSSIKNQSSDIWYALLFLIEIKYSITFCPSRNQHPTDVSEDSKQPNTPTQRRDDSSSDVASNLTAPINSWRRRCNGAHDTKNWTTEIIRQVCTPEIAVPHADQFQVLGFKVFNKHPSSTADVRKALPRDDSRWRLERAANSAQSPLSKRSDRLMWLLSSSNDQSSRDNHRFTQSWASTYPFPLWLKKVYLYEIPT